ncbi:MAG: small, acid-soluble spore protein, alpha/beta type [Bacillota bacterium]
MAKIMSEQLKYELAKELGVYNTVMNEGWGSVPSRECGNLVKLAIAKAEQTVANQRNLY